MLLPGRLFLFGENKNPSDIPRDTKQSVYKDILAIHFVECIYTTKLIINTT